jgi:hypothetical protein
VNGACASPTSNSIMTTSIPMMLLDKLIDIGVEKSIAVACINLHLVPTITLVINCGLLTGSPSAALLAILPILDVIEAVSASIVQYGIPTNINSYMHMFAQLEVRTACPARI